MIDRFKKFLVDIRRIDELLYKSQKMEDHIEKFFGNGLLLF